MKMQVVIDKPALEEMIGVAPAKVDLDKLALATWQKFGEAEGVAEVLREEFMASQEGSNTRRAIIETILKLFMAASDQGTGTEFLTEADLRAEAERILAEPSE